MKTITQIGLFAAIAASLLCVAPPARAQSVADCKAMIADLRTATEALVISGASPSANESKRRELLKKLAKADARLDAGGANNTYQAAIEVYHYLLKAHELGRKGRIAQSDADDLVDAATDTFNCIIAVYLSLFP